MNLWFAGTERTPLPTYGSLAEGLMTHKLLSEALSTEASGEDDNFRQGSGYLQAKQGQMVTICFRRRE